MPDEDRIQFMYEDPDFNEQEWREECNPSLHEIALLDKIKRRSNV